MERKPKQEQPVVDNRLWWINRGATFRMGTDKDARIIKPNQKFQADPEEIPKMFRDIIIPVDVTQAAQAGVQVRQIAYGYRIKERDDHNFDIVDAQGKVINETPMDEEKAKKVLARLLE